MDSSVVLREDDIPGASLVRRIPSQLKMEELDSGFSDVQIRARDLKLRHNS